MRKFVAYPLIVLMALPALAQQAPDSRPSAKPGERVGRPAGGPRPGRGTALDLDSSQGAKRDRLDGQSLPVRKVVLYKNGVGYFEHSGRVRGNQDVTVDFTTAQLNDVLQSLTVLVLGKGHIN